MQIDNLSTKSTSAEIAAALDHIAGWASSSHNFLLAELTAKTKRDIASLRLGLKRALQKRSKTKYARLKLKSFLADQGIKGRLLETGDLSIPDPLVVGEEIIVRDAVLLGSKPIVEKVIGYAHPVDAYVVALIGGADIKPFLISKSDVQKLAMSLQDCDAARDISPSALRAPNVIAFEESLDVDDWKRLLVTLRLNQRYSMVENAGQIVVFDNLSRVAYTREEFKAKIAPEIEYVRVGDKIKAVPRSKIWMENPARAFYSEVTFAPLGCDKHGRAKDLSLAFNLWVDFAQIGVAGDWSLLKDHIFSVLCRGDHACYEYVLNWLAHMLQKPWDKPGVAIVCWGDKRTGKGTVADAIREALGSELSRMFTQKEHVVGRFAGSAQPPVFNQIEEAVFARNPAEEGPLKSKITDPTETVELKFKTPYEVPSFGRWWFNSNSSTPVPITYDEERYMVLHVSNARASDHAYFAAIRTQLYHQGGLAAMVHELMSRDISAFNVRKPPHTDHRAKMVIEMLTHQDRAIADVLIEREVMLLDVNKGTAERHARLNENVPTWVDKDLVRSVLNDAFKRYGAKTASSGDITRILYDLGLIDSERNAHRTRGQNAGYRFLPLKEARANFAAKRRLDVALLSDNGGERSPLEELSDIVAAARTWCERPDLVGGHSAVLQAVKALEAALKSARAANDNRDKAA